MKIFGIYDRIGETYTGLTLAKNEGQALRGFVYGLKAQKEQNKDFDPNEFELHELGTIHDDELCIRGLAKRNVVPFSLNLEDSE